MDLVKTADRILIKHMCGDVEQTESAYLLTLCENAWAKADPAIKELKRISPAMEVYPSYMGERLVQNEYIIKKSQNKRTRIRQELNLMHAAMMASNPEQYWMANLACK